MKIKIQLRDAVVAGIIVVFGIFMFINIEAYEDEVQLNQGPEVDSQRFLAFQNHLANFNTEVVVSDDYNKLFSSASFNPIYPEFSDTIIFTESEVLIPQDLSDKVLSWVDKGGHIIVSLISENAESTFSTNRILKELGVRTKQFDQQLLEDNKDDSPLYSNNVPTIVNTEEYGEIEVNVDDRIYIDLAKYEDVVFSQGVLPDQQDHHATILQLSLGEGLVTLMSDVYIWNNYQIDEADNIFFIHQLIDYGNKVFIFEQREPIMWYQLILEYSPSFYWILLSFILILAWFYGIRFGAIKVLNNTVVTYFSQHIRAAGQFYWMNEQQDKLLAGARNQIVDEVSARLSKPNPKQEDIVEALANLSHWPKDKIYLFVYTKDNTNENQFTQIMQGLQQLRKMI